ncbi:MAG: hypothetical protein K0S18_2137 [Anaerocolumna sp.]|jgi:hypothetical protein|nr:hypothetical protein [Anaerocolumna sp.]
MQHCEHCRIDIRGNHNNCPLCQNALSENNREQDNLFPVVPEFYKNNVIIRMMIFISICIMVVSYAFDAMFPMRINRPLIIISGILCFWISFAVVIWKRHNIPKTIVWLVAIISVLAILWDWRMGWRGWSIDYVFPITCVFAMAVMYVTAKAMRLAVRDFLFYMVIDVIFGFLPLVFLIFGGLHVIYPSIISVAISVLSLAAIILFEGENIKEEINKRMHI